MGYFKKMFSVLFDFFTVVIAKGLSASYSLPVCVYGHNDLIAGQKIRILIISAKGRRTAGKSGCALFHCWSWLPLCV